MPPTASLTKLCPGKKDKRQIEEKKLPNLLETLHCATDS